MAHWLAREDVDAFIDARIAALHAGLRLSSEQEKLWPPLETAMRKVVERLRKDMGEWPDVTRRDLPALLRGLADRQAASADMLRELADALTPLYATFDDAQKRRFRRWLWTLPMHGLAIELMMPDL
ncbi:Spy/CpxP family protein refolding chaperone [Chelatococcus sp. SYSU_G07232]|uniref:Spy/CpxP family protein refolding chaperone n=1 Tax=Chelatococcus albus TaxID=3047466 RepID=A0ABT7AKD5_9HYPH|nr:Spy/CpxP family protein refolding chaperone [Chelatococcus sp. SYSU_G07232]MDJ1159823.1 Spy/CpxP family protein refolding chaperone [Chelatococcus sp. SYSU_G07232]